MNSRDRVMASISHKEPDRIPIDFGGTNCSSIHRSTHSKIAGILGIDDYKEEVYDIIQQIVRPDPRILKKFGNDTYLLLPGSSDGFELKINRDDRYSYLTDEWGAKYRMPHKGYFFDFCFNPLSEAGWNDIKNYTFPDPVDKGRIRGLRKLAKNIFTNTDYALIMSDGIWGMLQHSALLLGFQRLYEAIASDKKIIINLMERLLEYECRYWNNVLGQVKDYIQVIHISDDLGGQYGPNIDPDSYRKIIKPFHGRLVDYIKSNCEAKILFHSCGSVYEFIGDFIDVGIDILNPVQVSAANMDSYKLKKEFGKDIVFWGGSIDNQRVLPLGTQDDVREEVKKRISHFAPGGGYVFASVHNIQANVPAENVITMFETALEYGCYPIKV